MIRLSHFNRMWEQEFEQTRSLLLGATEGWIGAVEHIGSTAVPDMVARPTVDALAGMSDLSGLNEAALLIEGLNFCRRPAPLWCEDELVAYLEKPRAGEATHSVLLVAREGKCWQTALDAREKLRTAPQLRDELETIKKANFVAGCQAQTQYDASKSAFFDSLCE
ncbi:MAG TPA: GrpB family protein [Planctomycetaceae bacterium]|nr:GrpB family protein [Planctomycetaceae bacterium]